MDPTVVPGKNREEGSMGNKLYIFIDLAALKDVLFHPIKLTNSKRLHLKLLPNCKNCTKILVVT